MKRPKEIIKKTQEDYNIIASHFGQTRRVLWQDLKPFLEEVEKGDKVLDLGCGNARVFLALAGKKTDYIGVDFSEKLINQARKRFPKAKFILADITDKRLWQELREEKFDKVFLIAVLHHLPTPLLQRRLLRNIRRVLKNDSLLFLTVWNLWQRRFWKEHLKQLRKKITSGFKFKWLWVPYRLSNGREITREIHRFCYAFCKNELRKLLEKEGFKIEDIYYSKKGKKSNWLHGFNLCATARKMVK